MSRNSSVHRATRFLVILGLFLFAVCVLAPNVPEPAISTTPVSFTAWLSSQVVNNFVVAAKPLDQVVYITKTGSKYHRAGCRYLNKSKIKTTVCKARAAGYGPCSVCKPPKKCR